MSSNSLLLWMSARGEGSFAQFRAAVEELHLSDGPEPETDTDSEELADEAGLPLYHLLRLNLQRLGHAEFGAGGGESDWKVAAPCLAVTANGTGVRGVLAGARSRSLLLRVVSQGKKHGLEQLPVRGCPDVLRFHVEKPESLVEFASEAGVHVQLNAATAILMSLPPIDDRSMLREVPIPFGNDWKVERFSVDGLKWRPAEREEPYTATLGLFRYVLAYRKHVLLRVKEKTFEVPIQIGKYIVLRRRARRLLRYDSKARELSFPASCRPPFLVERALVACSGMLPQYRPGDGRSGTLHYIDISEAVAQTAAVLLRQELR